jgi:hypothetical protein
MASCLRLSALMVSAAFVLRNLQRFFVPRSCPHKWRRARAVDTTGTGGGW